MKQLLNGLWSVNVGTPLPRQRRVDTTASMGGHVDVVLGVLQDAYELAMQVLPVGYDLQEANEIFGDIQDRFVLCRSQFEMLSERIVEQLTLMVPERDGGDVPEDPHYGLFGAAYLTDAYINRIGLKGYDFTVSDAEARYELEARYLRRIFGDQIFEKAKENGYNIDPQHLPSTKEVVRELAKRSHYFFLQIGSSSRATHFWTDVFGPERVVLVPDSKYEPHIEAVIMGLTEGTLSLSDVTPFLMKTGVDRNDAQRIVRAVGHIPIGAQAALPNVARRPKAGDLFREKPVGTQTSPWPLTPEEIAAFNLDSSTEQDEGEIGWV